MLAELPTVTTTPEPSESARRGILELTPEELRGWLAQHGEPPMRAKQIRRWILQSRATSFEQMSDLPKALRPLLAEHFSVIGSKIEKHLAARDDTHKLLVKLSDGKMIECVLIQDVNQARESTGTVAARATACISTQVGCGMGCVFCASGINGVVRNLTAGEILEQLVLLNNLTVEPKGQPQYGVAGLLSPRLTNIVVMGMGEPLANLENLLAALAVAGAKDGLDIGARHITISTVGLPAKIRKLAEANKQYHLAVSLHAPNDTLRTEIVPTNTGTGIEEILAASDFFYEKTGRQVTFEYVVLGQKNDQMIHARQLVQLLRGRKAHVNLIPWNEVSGMEFRRPRDEDLNAFIEEIRRSGISVKVRKRKGSEIDAACGQLRRSHENPPPTLA